MIRVFACAAGAIAISLIASGPALAEDAPGRLILDLRLRSETVSQAGYSHDAEALTLRTHLGYETPVWHGFTALLEGENIAALDGAYNSTTNGKSAYPVVLDPEATEVNRAQIGWSGGETEVVVGRQRIVLGNARFVSNAMFRQNEQTFDAAKLVAHPLPNVAVTYAYVDHVHRIFGDGSPQGNWDSDSHLIQVEAKTPAGLLSGYGYLLAFDNAPTRSSATWGARLAGSQPTSWGTSVTYEVELARQTNYRNSPSAFDLDYLTLGLGVARAASWAGVRFEHLEGNGQRGFDTPLAFFMAWSDVFFTTPASGIRDISLRAGTSVPLGAGRPPLMLQAIAHDFADDDGSMRYGRELNVSAAMQLNPRLNAEVRAAIFDGARAGFADRDRLWLTLETKF